MFVLFSAKPWAPLRQVELQTYNRVGLPGTQQMLAEVDGIDKGMLMKLLLDHVLPIFYLPNKT